MGNIAGRHGSHQEGGTARAEPPGTERGMRRASLGPEREYCVGRGSGAQSRGTSICSVEPLGAWWHSTGTGGTNHTEPVTNGLGLMKTPCTRKSELIMVMGAWERAGGARSSTCAKNTPHGYGYA